MIAHHDCPVCATGLPNRRRVLGTLVGAAATLAGRAATGAPASPDDETFMRMAIEEAPLGDFPFGAVIVRDAAVIARGRNLGRQLDDATVHADAPFVTISITGGVLADETMQLFAK
jgi:tRNA(adenine34) deaminase